MTKQQTGLLQYKDLLMQIMRQNYQSIILGALVVLVAISVVVRLSNQPKGTAPGRSEKASKETIKATAFEKKNYTVKKGDTLWAIAEKQYGSGFNAVDITQTNKIKNPNVIEIGQKLTLPEVKAKQPTKGLIAQAKQAEVTIKEDKYTTKKGDYLWKIALEAYGDGYAWMKIAQANNLKNPDLIHAGNVLKIPR